MPFTFPIASLVSTANNFKNQVTSAPLPVVYFVCLLYYLADYFFSTFNTLYNAGYFSDMWTEGYIIRLQIKGRH